MRYLISFCSLVFLLCTSAFAQSMPKMSDAEVEQKKLEINLDLAKLSLKLSGDEESRQDIIALCNDGYAPACAYGAEIYYIGHYSTTKDRARAITMATKACEGGQGRSCILAGNAHRFGWEDLPRSTEKGDYFYRLGCEQNDGPSCIQQSRTTESLMYKEKKSVDERRKMQESLLSKGESIMKTACQARDGEACLDLAKYYNSPEGGINQTDARSAYRVACDLEVGQGCREMGSIYLGGLGVPVNPRSAEKYLKLGCQYGNKSSCSSLKHMPALLVKTREMLNESCQKGLDSYSRTSSLAASRLQKCMIYADVQKRGIGGEVDLPGAKATLEQACAKGHEVACKSLERMTAQ